MQVINYVSYLGKEHWLGLKNIYKLTNREIETGYVSTDLMIIVKAGSWNRTETYSEFFLESQVCI